MRDFCFGVVGTFFRVKDFLGLRWAKQLRAEFLDLRCVKVFRDGAVYAFVLCSIF